MNDINSVLSSVPVIPVLSIESLEDALPICSALIDGGLNVLEITLRTDCALEAISLVKKELKQAIVGAGTVTTPEQLALVVEAGADFAVSPGTSSRLLLAAQKSQCAFLPGVSTVSEMITALDAGFETQKLFPAEVVGGTGLLKAIGGPLSQLKFCPTGGIKPHNVDEYLSLNNVICVGGTWLTPKEAIQNKDWQQITLLAQQVTSKN